VFQPADDFRLGVALLQIRHGSRNIGHIGPVHDAEPEVLKAGAWQRVAAGQGELDLGLNRLLGAERPRPLAALCLPQDLRDCV
jgi:hypothetical protein